MKKEKNVVNQFISFTKLNAKKKTGIRKYENGNRSSCIVDLCKNIFFQNYITSGRN